MATIFDQQYQLQGGRCSLCQLFTLPQRLTFDHTYPRNGGQNHHRGRSKCTLMHESCNKAKRNKVPGSNKFNRWMRHVMNGNIWWQRSNQ